MLYFLDAAFKIQLFNWEMFIHSAIRLLTGFVLIGIGMLYSHKLRLKSAVYLILVVVLTDDILDFYKKVENLRAACKITDQKTGQVTNDSQISRFFE